MAIARKALALLAIGTAMLLLFVVVCPATPTPITVVSGKGTLPAPVVVAAISAGLSLVLAAERVSAVSAVAPSQPLFSHASVVDLTCARLC